MNSKPEILVKEEKTLREKYPLSYFSEYAAGEERAKEYKKLGVGFDYKQYPKLLPKDPDLAAVFKDFTAFNYYTMIADMNKPNGSDDIFDVDGNTFDDHKTELFLEEFWRQNPELKEKTGGDFSKLEEGETYRIDIKKNNLVEDLDKMDKIQKHLENHTKISYEDWYATMIKE